MIYFTGDLHLNHKRILEYADRPFSSVGEMNRVIIDNWISTVMDTDIVYINGDIALGSPDQANEQIKSLPGKKILLMGNHDVPKINDKTMPQKLEYLKYDMNLFEEVIEGFQTVDIPYKKYTFKLSHHPVTPFDVSERNRGELFLVGHAHRHEGFNKANMAFRIPVYDVGVDANGYKPISIDELFLRIKEWTSVETFYCDKCGRAMVKRMSEYGPFLGCSGYPGCDNCYNPLR